MGVEMKVDNYCATPNCNLMIQQLDFSTEIYCDSPLGTVKAEDLNTFNSSLNQADLYCSKIDTPKEVLEAAILPKSTQMAGFTTCAESLNNPSVCPLLPTSMNADGKNYPRSVCFFVSMPSWRCLSKLSVICDNNNASKSPTTTKNKTLGDLSKEEDSSEVEDLCEEDEDLCEEDEDLSEEDEDLSEEEDSSDEEDSIDDEDSSEEDSSEDEADCLLNQNLSEAESEDDSFICFQDADGDNEACENVDEVDCAPQRRPFLDNESKNCKLYENWNSTKEDKQEQVQMNGSNKTFQVYKDKYCTQSNNLEAKSRSSKNNSKAIEVSTSVKSQISSESDSDDDSFICFRGSGTDNPDDDNNGCEDADQVDCFSSQKKIPQKQPILSFEGKNNKFSKSPKENKRWPMNVSSKKFQIYEDNCVRQPNYLKSKGRSNKKGLMERPLDDHESFNSSKSIEEDCTPVKKVKFAKQLFTVHHLVHWNFAHRKARKGPWETIAIDERRFRDRIKRIEPNLSKVLDPCHRTKIYNERFFDKN